MGKITIFKKDGTVYLEVPNADNIEVQESSTSDTYIAYEDHQSARFIETNLPYLVVGSEDDLA